MLKSTPLSSPGVALRIVSADPLRDSLVMILSTEITTVHQAPFKEPTSDPVCSDYLDNRRSGTRVALDRFHWCCQAYLSLSISRLDLSYSPLFDYKYAPLPGKGWLI